MMSKIAIIGEGGGMRNAIVAGFVVGAEISPDDIDAYYGSSSSIGNALYFAAGQSDHALEMWVDKLTSKDVMDFKNPLRGKYLADMDHVVDNVCSSLDVNQMKKSGVDVIASVVNRKNGEIEYLELNDQNYQQVFKAACSIPYMSRPIEIEGDQFVDGGMGDNFPVMEAYDDGYRNFIILNNQSKILGYKAYFAKVVLDKISEKGLRSSVKNLVKNYYEAWDFIENPPRGVKIYHFLPEKEHQIFKFERDPEKVEKVYLEGVKLGVAEKEEVLKFISKAKNV